MNREATKAFASLKRTTVRYTGGTFRPGLRTVPITIQDCNTPGANLLGGKRFGGASAACFLQFNSMCVPAFYRLYRIGVVREPRIRIE